MSEDLIDLMDDLHKMQILLDSMICGFAALSTQAVDDNLRLTDYEAHEVAVIIREMVDKMIKRVEEAFKEQFCKPSPDKLDKYLKSIFCQKNAENNL